MFSEKNIKSKMSSTISWFNEVYNKLGVNVTMSDMVSLSHEGKIIVANALINVNKQYVGRLTYICDEDDNWSLSLDNNYKDIHYVIGSGKGIESDNIEAVDNVLEAFKWLI